MKSLKTILAVSVIFFSCIFFSSCPESAPCYWKFQFANNSIDTIGIAVFEHKRTSKDNNYICIQKENPIFPYSTISSWLSYDDGDDTTGFGESWGNYFDKSRIDTLCIIVYKNPLDYHWGEEYEMHMDSRILKIYKYYEENTDLKHMVSPTITYP